jgi:spore germination cell wall hydrolase CwlJ-like protein
VASLPPPPPDPHRLQELSCLAQAVYFEARSEDEKGQRAVAYVVLNRVGHPKFPDSVCGVIHQGGPKPPCQFSFYCDGRAEKPHEPKAWAEAQQIAEAVYDRKVTDPTGGALFFHQRGVKPAWKHGLKRTAEISGHIYYRPAEEALAGTGSTGSS